MRRTVDSQNRMENDAHVKMFLVINHFLYKVKHSILHKSRHEQIIKRIKSLKRTERRYNWPDYQIQSSVVKTNRN